MSKLIPSESEDYQMTHPVHSLQAEDFELLVGLIYQRQGYRVTMPAGLSGGHGGDFMVQRKSEQLLVQCKKLSPEDKVPWTGCANCMKLRSPAGATRGVYVASCGFSWDARNFAKDKRGDRDQRENARPLAQRSAPEAGRRFSRGLGMGAQAHEAK